MENSTDTTKKDFMINEYGKQYFLYAKGWYKETDMWEDLKKLHGIHYLIDKNEIKQYLLVKVIDCTLEVILEERKGRVKDIFQEFFNKLSPNYWVRGVFPTEKPYNYEDALLKECLRILRWAKVDNLDPEKDCRFDILPSSKSSKEEN